MKEFKDYPYLIAEMSGNHNHSLDRAFKIIDAAAEVGASAIKIQTYTADTISFKGVYKIEEPDSLWCGKDLHDLYDEAHTPWDWHQPIFEHAKKRDLVCFSSPFDESAVDLLESLNSPIYKVASFEINHIPLLKRIAQTKKPVIMSTGASTLEEIEEAVSTLRVNGCEELVLLKCTSTYPALPLDTNLNTIPHLKNLFSCEVGLSDHTRGIGVSLAAIGLGAKYIEKHFCLSRDEGGVDSAFSLEPSEFKSLTEGAKDAYLALGNISYGLTDSERKVDSGKRSIYVTKHIKAGEKITAKNIKIIRPGFGLHPRYYEESLNKIATTDLLPGTPLEVKNIA